jgi:sulfatase maturation enzyme AslB (radical SAM superfamily)
MLTLKQIKALNIEVSSICQANCPFCSRRQKKRPYGDHLITLSDFKRFPGGFLENLRRISFGGNFGDLCCNPEMPEIAAYIRKTNPVIILEGETNGSLQSEDWWKALGKPFSKGCMVFSLDGLEDTHRLHRKGTDFHAIIRNLRAFVSGGGVAHWKFIVFAHNEHQIEDAERLAQTIGCARFYAMSSRDNNAELQKAKSVEFDTKREMFYSNWEHLAEDERQAICKPLENGSLYIAADGTVHPCCLAHCMYITEHNRRFRFVVPIIEKYYDEINFKTTPLQEILDGPYFTEVLSKSKTNEYCAIKCNRHKRKIRRETVLHERFFR